MRSYHSVNTGIRIRPAVYTVYYYLSTTALGDPAVVEAGLGPVAHHVQRLPGLPPTPGPQRGPRLLRQEARQHLRGPGRYW